MAFFKFDLTIFQKMLVAPVVAMLLYSSYLIYIYGEHKQSSMTIARIQDSYIPVLDLTGESIVLFDVISSNLKDAVLAGEREWVLNTSKDQEHVENNLLKIKSYLSAMHSDKKIDQLSSAFNLYYKNAFALSIAMMSETLGTEYLNELIENVEKYHQKTTFEFNDLKSDLQRQLSQQIDGINFRLNQLVLIGIGMGLVLMTVIIGLTFTMSLSTRRSLKKVETALKNIAQDKPGLTARISHQSGDELGEIVKWFNLLSTKLEQDYKKIELLSITDKLTQLYNRAKIDELFQMELNKAVRYHGPLSLILLDLDNFKSVNDEHGHLVGDKVLKELANLLKDNIRSADHLGRWGGEEFLILSSNTTLEQAIQHAEKLRLMISQYSFSEVGNKSASFGVASYHQGDDGDSMTKRADDCLYIAKERGRNIVVTENEILNA